MKTHFRFLLILLISGTLQTFAKDGDPAAGGDPVSPKPNPVTAPDASVSGSSAELAPPPQSVEPSPNPFEGVSLAGYCGQGETLTVFLFLHSGKEKKRIKVFGDASPFRIRDTSGYRVIGINRGKTLKSTSIILEKDGQQGTVMFNDDTLRTDGSTALPGGVQEEPVAESKPVPQPAIPRPAGSPNPQRQICQGPALFIPGQCQPYQPAAGCPPGSNNYSSNLFIPGRLGYQQMIYPPPRS